MVQALGPLVDEVVFVGGQVAELLVSDPAAIRVRPTDDVDVICDVATLSAYDQFAERLRGRGFKEVTTPGAPLCRWRVGSDILDVMPAEEKVHGLRGRWYPFGMRSAMVYELAKGIRIRILSAPVFLATKWEAFEDRGAGDPYGSHDLEDIVSVVAGRPEVVGEINAADPEVRQYLADQTGRFLESGSAADVIAGALPDARLAPELLKTVEDRLRGITLQ